MAIKHGKAQTFEGKALKKLLKDVEAYQDSKANAQPGEVMRCAFMLSFFAGLRVQEIAGLEWDINIFNADGEFRVAPTQVTNAKGSGVFDKDGDPVMKNVVVLHIHDSIGKYGKGRDIAMPKDLQNALMVLRDLQLPGAFVIPSAKNGASTKLTRRAHALKMRMNRMYTALGFERASSHSGRRSFGTRAARRAELYDNSLVDVRDMMGHASIGTTQKYVDPSLRQADLVEAIWKD